MRRLLVLFAFALLPACSGDVAAVTPDAGDPEDQADAAPLPDGAPGADARPMPDAGGADAMTLPPSTANVGWIGGACKTQGTCAFTDGMCLTEGFPNGMCTKECTGLCPDRTMATDTVTTCVDGRPFGFDQGLCVSRCDKTRLPPTGCAAGYRCLPKTRYLDSGTVIDVCVPAAATTACAMTDDELLDVNYPDDGKLWIPHEARCGGSYDLVVMMHGINPSMNHTPSLGGGRRLEYEVRSLIDTRSIKPVLLAEPVHVDSGAASSTGLYDPDSYEPAVHINRLKTLLDARNITIASLSFIGHSGAGCDSDNGLYLVLKRYGVLIPSLAPTMRLWGMEDVCYTGAYHYTAPMATLTGKDTVMINVWSVQNDPTDFENHMFPDPADLPCASSILTRCIRHKVQPWCSYRTRSSAGIGHEDNPYFFVREAFPQVFATDPSVVPCR